MNMERIPNIGDMILSRVFLAHFCKVIDIRKPLFKKPNFYNCKYKVQDIFHSNKTAWCTYQKVIRIDADLSDYDRNACWDSAGDFADRVLGVYRITEPISGNDEMSLIICDPIMELPEIGIAYFRHRNDACNWVNGTILSMESNHYMSYDIVSGQLTLDEFNWVVTKLHEKWSKLKEVSNTLQFEVPDTIPDYDFNTITILGGNEI